MVSKLNAVVCRGLNDSQLLPLAELARNLGWNCVREYMDVGIAMAGSRPVLEMIQRADER